MMYIASTLNNGDVLYTCCQASLFFCRKCPVDTISGIVLYYRIRRVVASFTAVQEKPAWKLQMN